VLYTDKVNISKRDVTECFFDVQNQWSEKRYGVILWCTNNLN